VDCEKGRRDRRIKEKDRGGGGGVDDENSALQNYVILYYTENR
jgi:hypothetical protein